MMSPSVITRMKSLARALRLLSQPVATEALAQQLESLRQVAALRNRYPTCRFSDSVVFHSDALASLSCGDDVRISAGVVFGCYRSEPEPCSVIIGNRTYVGEYCNMRTSPRTQIRFGQDVLIAQFCSFVASNHEIEGSGPIALNGMDSQRVDVDIEDGAWIGAGVVVLPGVRVGAGAVVGANSVVTKDVPSREIWAGVPAKRIGLRGELP